jgi:hypothetical protein
VEKGQIKALGGRHIPGMTNGGSKKKFQSRRLVIVDRRLGISDDESASYPESISYLDHGGDDDDYLDHVGDDDDNDDDDEGVRVDKSEYQDSSVFADALELEELEVIKSMLVKYSRQQAQFSDEDFLVLSTKGTCRGVQRII